MLGREATLAQAPILGGAPRQVLEDVTFADWSPTGALAVVRVVGSRQRLEFPPGHVLFETEGEIGWPRISPAGDRIAFLDWPVKGDDRGTVAVVDTKGEPRRRSREHGKGSAGWHGRRRATGVVHGERRRIDVRTLGVRRSMAASAAFSARRPRWSSSTSRRTAGRSWRRYDRTAQVNGWFAGEPGERDVSWRDFSFARDLSADGRRVLLTDFRRGQRPQLRPSTSANRRDLDATRLGEGEAQQFSPDGQSVLAVLHGPPSRLQILPMGTGEPRIVATGQVKAVEARWLPDGNAS